jgi:heat shock protein 4
VGCLQVNYLGEDQVFSATQLYAAYLGQLRDITTRESKAAVNDLVIAVPGWYTDVQRRAVLDAAEIAGVNTLRLINDTTATALGYGITKLDLPEKDARPRYVAFIDIGHSDYSVSIVAYHKSQLTVKSTAFDRHFGGRDIDHALVQHFAEEFKGKYKIDVLSNKKALFRLATSVERLKKILSANAQAPLNVESIMNDIDASSSLDRETFEKLISPLLDRTIKPLESALADANLTKDDIDAIELVGGSTRIPSLKGRIQEFFGKTLSFTSNQDEAIARGATLTCATLSPVFKVRDFEITDMTPYPIDITWESTPETADEGTSLRVYDKGSPTPSTKILTFYRKEPFDLEARYADPSSLPGGINPFIARYTIKNVTPTPKGDLSQIRVRVRLNPNGILDFGPASLVEEVEQEPEAAAPAPAEGEAAPMDTDAAKTNGDAPPPPPKKKKTVKKELPGVAYTTSLDPKVVANMREQEGQMHASDKLVAETEERKNALEEYIYDVRGKLEGPWAPFATAADKEALQAKLTAAEDWLYSEEGEDAKKSDYVAKLDELKALGDPIRFRAREAEERPRAERALRETLARFQDAATSGDEKYSHLSEEDLSKVRARAAPPFSGRPPILTRLFI